MILEKSDLEVGATAGGGGEEEALEVDSGSHGAVLESGGEVQAAGGRDHSEFIYIGRRRMMTLIILLQSPVVCRCRSGPLMVCVCADRGASSHHLLCLL